MVRQAVRQAHGPEQSRRTHHLTTLSQPVESLKVERVEGQITMTKIQNNSSIVIHYFFSSVLPSGFLRIILQSAAVAPWPLSWPTFPGV